MYIFQSCTWLLTLFPTSRFSTQNQEFQRVLLVVLLYCSIFKISFTVVFDSFYILSHLFVFVKPFFQIFSNSFSRLVFRLDVTFIYCITFLSVCQALFQDFLIFSFGLFSRLTWQLIYITTFICFCQHFSCTFGTIYTFNTLFNTNHKSFSIKSRLKKQLIDYKR